MNATAARQDAAGPAPERSVRDHHLATLLAQAAQGNAAAFEAFYDATASFAEALARRILRAGDVEDLLAEVYFEAWRHAARFDAGRGSAVTWLLTLVRSRAIDLLRRQAAQPDVADGEEHDLADDHPGPEALLWRAQAGSRLHAALAGLGADERWVLGLAYFKDMSHAAIASTTGLPLGSVKSLILRAQHKLRDRLAL